MWSEEKEEKGLIQSQLNHPSLLSPIPCFSMSPMRSASCNSGGGVVTPSHICDQNIHMAYYREL